MVVGHPRGQEALQWCRSFLHAPHPTHWDVYINELDDKEVINISDQQGSEMSCNS